MAKQKYFGCKIHKYVRVCVCVRVCDKAIRMDRTHRRSNKRKKQAQTQTHTFVLLVFKRGMESLHDRWKQIVKLNRLPIDAILSLS